MCISHNKKLKSLVFILKPSKNKTYKNHRDIMNLKAEAETKGKKQNQIFSDV